MDFHTELVKITEFQPLEHYLMKKKNSELIQISNSEKITASVNPSNLVELTRLGERFAIDSCVYDQDIKYVVGDELLPNKYISTHLFKNQETPDYANSFEAREKIMSIIPQLIVRQRPGISYKPLKESNYTSPSIEFSEPKIISMPNQKEITPIISVETKKKNQTLRKAESLNNKKTIKMNKESSGIKNSTIDRNPIQSKPKSKKNTRSKKIKTILRKKSEPQNEEISISSQSERKTVTWDELGNADQIMKDHEIKRKEHLDKFKYQYPSYLKEKETKNHQDSLNKLEKIVEEEKEFLHDKGIYTPGSSEASKYQKTYEELEQEIKNIKEMLEEDNNKKNTENKIDDYEYEEGEEGEREGEREGEEEEEEEEEENASIEYSYSSDEAKIDDDKWMKPRFKSSN